MPKITDPLPYPMKVEFDALRLALDVQIPPKILDQNILIATWNLRAFGGLTEEWESGSNDSPKRDLYSLRCITEIISRFDIVALQEVKADLKAIRHMLKLLGSDWSMILTDVTRGAPGNSERLAFLFDMRKIQLSGLACELVVPQEELDKIGPDALQKQFARTPYAVSFRSAKTTFILVTLHVLYGDAAEERAPELKGIAAWLSEWAKEINEWDHNLMALGDFNIDRRGNQLYEAFTSTGLFIPEDLNQVPRTIFSDPDKPDLGKFYDQIAWFTGANGTPALSLKYQSGGSFDFTRWVLKSRNLTRTQLSWHISDHYPLWAEFSIRE